jgi:outer membrane protein assembly factor BamB
MLKKLICIIFITSLSALGADWPDFRGPHRDGVWAETGIVEKFTSNPIKTKWRIPIGAGYTGPSIANGKVYVMDRIEEFGQERVLCVDENTGAKVWEYSYKAEYRSVGYPAGPRASVIINEGKAYTLGTMGHLFCLETTSGKLLWKKDLNAIYDIKMPNWGIAAAPLIVDDKVVLHIGGRDNACVIALDKNSGQEKWTSLDDEASYSAPILIRQAGKKVVVVWTGESVAGLNPESGSIFWQIPFDIKSRMGISSPVLYKNYIFVSCFFNGSLLIKLDTKKLAAEKVWQRAGKNERNSDALHCCINTALIKDNYIYGIDSYGELRCLDLLTGDRIWQDLSVVQKNRWANVHFIQNGENTWMFNENGELIIGQLSPKGFKQISRAKLIEPTTEQLSRKGQGVTWSFPGFANRHVFIRNDKELLCADLSL